MAGIGRTAALRIAALGIGAALAIGATRIAPAPVAAQSARPAARPAPKAVAKPPVAAPEPAAYVVKRVLPIDGPFRHGDWYWDEAGAPPGEIVVTVDLAAQVLSVFRGGYEIGTAVVIYGADDKPTPLGVFAVSQKDAKHVSSIYNAPMPYTLRLTNDGVSIHGTKIVRPDYATHGCVGLPTPFAAKLFGVVGLGTKVIVSNGERLDVGGAITAARS